MDFVVPLLGMNRYEHTGESEPKDTHFQSLSTKAFIVLHSVVYMGSDRTPLEALSREAVLM